MSRAVLSAGSNVGDRRAHLESVVSGFADELVAVSSVYATPPWGGVEQDDFYNIALIVDGPLSAAQWLARGAALEEAADRVREVRWGPRTLDVDVITVSDDHTTVSDDNTTVSDNDDGVVVSDDPVLTLPHPRAAQRAFVLIPWLEIDPAAALWTPDGVVPVEGLLKQLDDSEKLGVRRVDTIGWASA
ncbi:MULTISPECIES: 2-amino-4-hydroxy-6-hydroxymethyldihydropteridine diphosphokinase [unclassified Gordonia (in: high G+C Gram-positive bacteria)]|uniref:2-amino-4-hydroxy-6- hydroxymethyldihydropteridine diphosphokinase n=1 Tax=unclassified Gordonia (in: high G+C Gram-positive bacteria) TaxID=2657482 RepID=UPI001F0D246A|nr:2-amino-4-hydroxy-6-hydroxymethyldihydropteridine diphosphokinase [Gordonia sp. ABSL49_1]MCH5643771.1 2-amino-4-hydroxy-6-hydroxymethyldihydropteridine diphosphokinase [Gordonia sp. ABSL49_1]